MLELETVDSGHLDVDDDASGVTDESALEELLRRLEGLDAVACRRQKSTERASHGAIVVYDEDVVVLTGATDPFMDASHADHVMSLSNEQASSRRNACEA